MSAPRKLRLMTLNIAHGRGLSTYQGFHRAAGIERNLRKIASLLQQQRPDVVALQEVDADSHWNRRIHLLDFLKAAAQYPHSFLGIHNRRHGRWPLAYGNGVLSHHAIVRVDQRAFGTAVLGEKGFLYTELRLPSGQLPIINLHLDFRSRQRRILQVEQLIDYLEARPQAEPAPPFLPPIICGDFNSRRTCRRDAVRHLWHYLLQTHAYQLLPSGGKTFPSLLPLQGLDFIFVPPSYRVTRCEVLRCYVSDHRPVVVDLQLAGSDSMG
jgi:endonuclease/exonuclease/phosphatase family metal-dependent hydrolase